MTVTDAERWNARYRQSWYADFVSAQRFLTEHEAWLPRSGLALDVAMGMGGCASFLASLGLGVVGVDIAWVAVRQAKQRQPELMAVVADLEAFFWPPAVYDVICNFYYLDRALWPAYRRSLRPGGILVLETLTQDMLQTLPDLDPAHLLKPGELRDAFPGFKVEVYQEGWQASERGHLKAVASLLARKIE